MILTLVDTRFLSIGGHLRALVSIGLSTSVMTPVRHPGRWTGLVQMALFLVTLAPPCLARLYV
jgi:hypothetical protein